jgi:hypothetical protein
MCGKKPQDGFNLYRQNQKGDVGVWACSSHSKPIEDELVHLVGVLQKANTGKSK